jgi:hypothetical protein
MHTLASCVLLASCFYAAGGNWVEEGGQRFYSNPAQKPASEECTDVAPDDRYTCEQQVSCCCWQLPPACICCCADELAC